MKKKQPDAVEELSCSVETIPAVIEEPPKPQKALTELQTIRVLSNKMESVEQVADAEGMLSEVESAADAMIYRLDVCFEHYPEFLKNPNINNFMGLTSEWEMKQIEEALLKSLGINK